MNGKTVITEWSERHEEHAEARLLEVAARLRRGDYDGWRDLAAEAARPTQRGTTELRFRDLLLEHALNLGIDVEREVRRVDAAAAGRVVETRATRWRVYDPEGDCIIETDDGGAKPDKHSLVEHLIGACGDGRCSIVPVKITRRRWLRKGKAS